MMKTTLSRPRIAKLIYTHSLGRAARYFPERTAFVSNGMSSTFRELQARVERVAGVLTRHGFEGLRRFARSPGVGSGADHAIGRSLRPDEHDARDFFNTRF